MFRLKCYQKLKLKDLGKVTYMTNNTQENGEIKFSNGRILKLNKGKFSKLADGCCVASIGDTNVMVTAVSKIKPTLNSFIPFTVDYREKSSAFGRVPTNYLKRDLAPSEKEILCSRLIDRSLRSSFPKGYYYETQIVCNLLSVDSNNSPDIASLNAASAALALSNIPWDGPVATVRVSLIDNDIQINPTRREMLNSQFNLIVTTNEKKNILMLEGNAKEPILLNDLLKMIKKATKENSLIIKCIKDLQKTINIQKRQNVKFFVPTEQQIADAKLLSESRLRDIFDMHNIDKLLRDEKISLIKEDVLIKLKETYSEEDQGVLNDAFYSAVKQVYIENIFLTNQRCDGRRINEIRPLHSEVSLFKPLHGSAMFQRGQTQVLGTVAFDSLENSIKFDTFNFQNEIKEKNFFLNYTFPPFATNEIGKIGSYGRREIGHGALAEKALTPLLPNDFPFTICLNAEVFESNGSSSMASVCVGSLALMDAGVQLKEHVAGIAMGLVLNPRKNDEKQIANESVDDNENKQEYKILTDISGFEDYFGEMDFKIAGTKKGCTALQLDCKLKEGLKMSIIMDALVKAHEAKSELINHMSKTLTGPVKKKDNWPVTEVIEVESHKRGQFIGPSGFNLKKIKSDTGVSISMESEDQNKFRIFAPNQEAMNEAQDMIEKITKSEKEIQLEFGGVYTAKIVEIKDYGVMIILYPDMQPALLHNNEIDRKKIHHPSALNLEVGQELQVKYFGRDPATGQMRLSRRVLQMTGVLNKNLVSTE